MQLPECVLKPLGIAAVALLLAVPATAEVEDQLSAYTGVNAEGYMQPIVDAFGANLADAFFYSAYIPKSGVGLKLEFAVMSVNFGDDDKTFMGTTEGGFMPQQTVEVPTIAGSPNAVTVTGAGGTQFSFPGGLDLSSSALAVPQLRIGSIAGTEALIRFWGTPIGDSDIGDINLFGLGIRHSLSQYFDLPVGLALGGMYQTFSLGDDLVDSNAFTLGLQTSKRFALLEPYGALSWDYFKMDVTFDSDVTGTPQSTTIDFDANNTFRLTLGLGLNYVVGNAFVEYNIASTNSFALGLTLGK
jgi:hypothetical protein